MGTSWKTQTSNSLRMPTQTTWQYSQEVLMAAKNFSAWLKPSWSGPEQWKLSLPNVEVWPWRSQLLSEQMGRTSATYTPYDPQLQIGGKEIPLIHQSPMRFLGQEIFKDLSDKEIRSGVESKLKDLLVKVDKDNVNSIAKMWMYENHIVSRISWEFIIYCFLISFAQNLQAVATRYLKRWAGLPKCANPSILYRKRENKGLQLKALTTHLKCM